MSKRVITTVKELVEEVDGDLAVEIRIASSPTCEWNVLSMYEDDAGDLWLDIEKI